MNEKKSEVISIKNLCISIFDEKNEVEIDVSKFCNKTIVQDLKLLMFYMYKKNNLVLRDKIIIKNKDVNLSDYKDKIIFLKTKINTFYKNKEKKYVENKNDTKELSLGKFVVVDKNTIKPSENNILFEIIKEDNSKNYNSDFWKKCIGKDNLKGIFEKYNEKKDLKRIYLENGLLKIYYDMTLEAARINNIERIAGKVSAMCSYLAIKKIFNDYFDNEQLNYEISNPNVFVRNNNVEYDALVVKKNFNNKEKFLFSEKDVVATIEIKTSGLFITKEELKTKIDDNKNETNGFIDYLASEKIDGKKHIYISIYESFGSRNDSIHYYEYLSANFSVLENEGYYGIFCGIKKDQNYFLIPYEYDLKAILDKIF